ncbi:MAG: type I CRISPR-associated protein Cas7 [Planctomycetales bacterium]|nr:type I CRISPR-associated protein Cas7 [Planctomycetales bacterium]
MTTATRAKNDVRRITGLLVIEVVNSNPNGDPDRDSDPRQRPDLRGEISPVSLKRKLRDLVEDKDGIVWTQLADQLGLDAKDFGILESRGRDRKTIEKQIKDGTFSQAYWDGRVFGNTFLEEGASGSIKTGVVQVGLGISVAPIDISRHTNTNKSGVQEGKDRGMAPMGYRFVPHGVYCMPFFVNPSMAPKSGCTQRDIDLMLRLIPYAYSHTRSHARPMVEIRHAWAMTHNSQLGSCSDFALIDALRPTKTSALDEPSTSWDDYAVPTSLPRELSEKARLVDLVSSL